MSYEKQELFTLRELFFGGNRVAHLFSIFVFSYYVSLRSVFPCCDVFYDFHIKKVFGSSLPPVVCRRSHVLFMLFVFACA